MLLTNFLPDHCCGGRTRTCDLQVMSLASYQLLHTAIYSTHFLIASAKVLTFLEMTKCFLYIITVLTDFKVYYLLISN